MRETASCCCFVAEMLISPCQSPKIFHSMRPKWNIGRGEFSYHVWRRIPTTALTHTHTGLLKASHQLLPPFALYVHTKPIYCLIVAGSCDTPDFLHPVLTGVVKDRSDFPPRAWLLTTIPVQAAGRELSPRSQTSHKEPGDDVAEQSAQCEPINKVSNVLNGPLAAARQQLQPAGEPQRSQQSPLSHEGPF